MPVKKITIYECDLCGSEYDPQSVQPTEYTEDVVSQMRIIGYYKPQEQCKIDCICKACSNKIISLIDKLKSR